jgi:tRNA-splicing endonuclease subunit Sen2
MVALAAEQFREKRRLERKQFKIDRAAAMLDAAKTAEAVLVTGQAPPLPGEQASIEEEADEDGDNPGRPGSPTPSTATTAVDVSHLTPQTYLVRPTRPDANRNRGRKAFKRKPAPAKGAQASATPAESSNAPVAAIMTTPVVDDVDDEVEAIPEEEEFDDSLIEEMEHLQLSLEEAWFLSTAIGVLKILDPETVSVCIANGVERAHVRILSFHRRLSCLFSSLRPLK